MSFSRTQRLAAPCLAWTDAISFQLLLDDFLTFCTDKTSSVDSVVDSMLYGKRYRDELSVDMSFSRTHLAAWCSARIDAMSLQPFLD